MVIGERELRPYESGERQKPGEARQHRKSHPVPILLFGPWMRPGKCGGDPPRFHSSCQYETRQPARGGGGTPAVDVDYGMNARPSGTMDVGVWKNGPAPSGSIVATPSEVKKV